MKTYTDKEKLKKCKGWLIDNELSIRGLSRKISISEQSLHDYIRGRMTSGRLDKVFGLNSNNGKNPKNPKNPKNKKK